MHINRKFLRVLALLLVLVLIVGGSYAQGEVTTNADTPLSVTLAVPDGAAPPLQFSVDSAPQNGVLLGTAPVFTYQPNAGFVGTDTVTYTIVDGNGSITTNTIVINVTDSGAVEIQDNNAPPPPGALPDRDTALEPNMALSVMAGESANLELIRGSNYNIVGLPEHGTLTGQVPFVTYVADGNYTGYDTFTYSVTDGFGNERLIPILVEVAGNPAIPFVGENVAATLELVELDGTPGIVAGEQFDVLFKMYDQRSTPQTVFSGFVDVTFDNALLQLDSISYGTNYTYLQQGTTGTGTIDELGAVSSVFTASNNSADFIIAAIRMTALSDGTANINMDAAEDQLSETTIYGLDTDQRGSIAYGSLQIPIVSTCPGGVDTIGIYRDTDRSWYLRNSNTPGASDLLFPYGDPSDLSVTGDWDGDGVDTVGIYRNGTFYLKNTNVAGNADITFGFGSATDLPVAGDWDGDCIDEVGIYRPSQGAWFLLFENQAQAPDLSFTYGLANETPIAGDWDGDGIDTIGIFRGSDRSWYMKNTNSGGASDLTFPYGDPAQDVPVVGDWDGDGTDTVGIYRFAIGEWFLRNSNTAGPADTFFTYGLTDETPVTGDWDGN